MADIRMVDVADARLRVMNYPLWLVVAVAGDDPYGAQWFYGPYAARDVADRVATIFAEADGWRTTVQPVHVAVPA